VAITLAQTIAAANDNPVYLSADTNAPAFKIDNEQFLIVAHAAGPTRSIPSVDPSNPSGAGVYGAAAVTVARGWNGTDPGPHAAGATVTPLFYSMTATQGATV
jgi:hypothetical protein